MWLGTNWGSGRLRSKPQSTTSQCVMGRWSRWAWIKDRSNFPPRSAEIFAESDQGGLAGVGKQNLISPFMVLSRPNKTVGLRTAPLNLFLLISFIK